MSLSTVAKIGPYEIVDLLGAGGMGEVYRGRGARLGRDVALKVLPANFVADGLYKNPEIIFPSKLFHRTNSASGNESVFTAVSLAVQRSTFPLATSTE